MFWKKKHEKFSVENLQYLHELLVKNPTVTPQNIAQLVEGVRLIAEVMIWGDQNNPRFFEFFCEKAFLSHFSKYLAQRDCGAQLQVQIIQSLSILIANTNSTEMIFYLLSNNHINDLIVYPFKFENEEILSHYISFLKTLSLRLDPQTIQFFFNSQAQDFPLYTEAIKFFKHPETMVRIAVRTLSLNVYKVNSPPLREFIIERSAIPYFSNIVWFLRDQTLALNQVIDGLTVAKVEEALELQVDYFYYLQDILQLDIEPLTNILVDQMLCHYILPTLVGSLTQQPGEDLIKPWLAMYTLSQLLTLFKHPHIANAIGVAVLEARPIELLRFLVTCPPQYGVKGPTPIAVALTNAPVREVVEVHAEEFEEHRKLPVKPKRKPAEPRPVDQNLNPRSKLDVVQTSNPFLNCSNWADHTAQNEHRDFLLAGLSHEDERVAFQSLLLLRCLFRNSGVERRLLESLRKESVIESILRLARPQASFRVVTVQFMCEVIRELTSSLPQLNSTVEGLYGHAASIMKERFSGSRAMLLIDIMQDEYPLMQQPLSDNGLMTAAHFSTEGKMSALEQSRKEIQVYLLMRRLFLFWQHRQEDELTSALLLIPTIALGTEVALSLSSGLACLAAVNNCRVHMLLLTDPELLILVQRNPEQPEMGRIQLVLSLAHQEAFANRYHPGILHITLRSTLRPHEACRRLKVGAVPVGDENAIQTQRDKPLWNLTLLFQDAQQCHAAKLHFDERRAKLREKCINAILQHLQSAPPAAK